MNSQDLSTVIVLCVLIVAIAIVCGIRAWKNPTDSPDLEQRYDEDKDKDRTA